MSEHNLFDAMRAELRARLALSRTSAGLQAAFEQLTTALAGFRRVVETSSELAQVEGVQRQLLADLLALELHAEEIGDQLIEHRQHLARSFGVSPAR